MRLQLYLFLSVSFFASTCFSQNFSQGILYAKLKMNARTSAKSTAATKIGVTEQSHLSQRAMLRSKSSTPTTSGMERMIKIKYDSNYSPEEAAKIMMTTGLYEYVEPSPIFSPLYVPNDTFASDQFANPFNGQSPLFTHDFWSAWDIERGDTNVIVAIVDNGINFNHEDLQRNLKINHNDPVNGINDDGYTYYGYDLIDNYRGWDVADWDNDPSIPENYSHGTEVTGIIGATPDNEVGIAGIGFNCKFVPYKVSSDSTPNAYTHGYDGAIIAGENGAKVINLSWGSASENVAASINTINTIINYLVYDLNAVVVGAAANTGSKATWYPAAASAAISVTGIHTDNNKQNISTYDYTVDIAACGRLNKTTRGLSTSDYVNANGTSLAAPVVSGAAALVRSRYPDLYAIQVNHLLRVTGDIIDTTDFNLPYQYMMGRKLNPYRALTEQPSAFRLTDFDSTLTAYTNGDVLNLSIEVFNYLASSSANTTARLISLDSTIIVTESIIPIGAIPTFGQIRLSDYFTFAVPEFSDTLTLEFIIEYKDDNMIDHEYLQVTVLPDLLTTTASDLVEEVFSISPNPAKDKIHLRFVNPLSISSYALTNSLGATVAQQQINKYISHYELDLPELIPGIYFLSVKTDNRIYTKKVLIK